MGDENRKLSAILNGLAKHDYYGDSEITDTFLKDELYPNISEAEFSNLLHKCRGLIRSMATTDMDFNQTEIFLSSQVKKKDGGFTEDQSKVFMKFWRNNRNKIHESLVKKCMWNNSLKHLSWRIDVKSRARDLDEISTPTAIVELQIENTQLDKDVEVKRFEMDESSLSRMLSSLKDIEEQIEKHSK